jgi:TolB-like protein/Tfp pilus assembly protein PilF
MSFFNELKRRNVFKVAAAYIIVGWLIMQVGDTLGPALLLPGWINSALAFFLILGFPLALFFAWAFEMTPEGLKKEKEVDRSESITHVTSQKLNGLIIGLLALALGYFAFDKFVLDPERDAELVSTTQVAGGQAAPPEPVLEPVPKDNSIAVLPFVNMSDDPANEYFSDGITEELLNLLAKIPELRVTSRSSAFSFKGQNVDIPTVADKLNVAHVLEGSVRKAGNRVRITAQLIEAGSDVHMWSETYDRELDDVFAIQDEIAREVVTVLQVQLLGEEVPTVAETDSEAYAWYLQGKHFIVTTEEDDTAASAAAFRKAIEIDPEYAPAWAGLARTQRNRANWGQIDLREGTEEARQAAHRALELDNTLADAWAVLTHIQWVYDWDWNRAEGTARTALQHGPNDARALETAALVARSLGKFDEALKYAKAAVNVDPLDPFILRTLALTHWARREYGLQQKVFERARDLYPERSGSWSNIAFGALDQNRPEEALALADKEKTETFRKMVQASAYDDLGRKDEARQALQYVIDNESDWLAYQIAEVYGDWGSADQAFEWLEKSYAIRDGGITYLVGDPALESLHDDPRWEPFLLKVGLLDAWKNAERWRTENKL